MTAPRPRSSPDAPPLQPRQPPRRKRATDQIGAEPSSADATERAEPPEQPDALTPLVVQTERPSVQSERMDDTDQEAVHEPEPDLGSSEQA